MKKPTYLVNRTQAVPELRGKWNGTTWANAAELSIAHFHPDSSDHRPQVKAKLLHDQKNLYAIFSVLDRYVRCSRTRYQSITSRDSCVELMVKPRRGKGYFSFEVNCGGALLFYYITDPTRVPHSFKEFVKIPRSEGKKVRLYHSAPAMVEPEIRKSLRWVIELAVPLAILEKYVGPLGDLTGQTWRGNLFKCADQSSHPHWASWSPIDKLNFHVPKHFGKIRFG